MRRASLKTKLQRMIAAFFLAVLLVWALFFAYSARSLVNTVEESAVKATEQIIGVLEEQFLEVERISFTLSQSEAVKAFMAERDFLAYHEKAEDIRALLGDMRERADFVEHLILFSGQDHYYRFWGTMGNTSATKLYYEVSPTEQPAELLITLDGMEYVGYAIGVYRDGAPLGTILLLIEEEKLQSLFGLYRADDALQISLAAGERLVTSSDPASVGMPVEEFLGRVTPLDSRKVGFTPFEILVTAKDGYVWRNMGGFVLTAIATALIFAALLLAFMRTLNRSFFTPMLEIMQGVERLGTGAEISLPPYRDEHFNRLAETINHMLRRLDERNKTLFETERRLQQSEIAKHRAVIVSLKKQISAHFTVNVLSVIKRLAELGEMQKTGEMCDGLSYMLRYANAGDEFIGGLEEFFVLRQYVGIMQIRYEGRFQAEFDPDERLGDVEIPRMLIQPMIENAILHGLQKSKAGGRLSVRAALDGGRLRVVVEDNGIGMSEPLLEELRGKLARAEEEDSLTDDLEHVALVNIQRRARSYYRGDSGLLIESNQGEGTKVTLILDGVV